MAEILTTDLTVKNGQVICVKNTDKRKFSNADERYYALWIDTLHDGEQCLFFTGKEFASLIVKHIDTDIANILELGKLYTYKNKYMIKVKSIDQTEHIIQFGEFLYKRALKRCAKNTEDIPTKSWFTNYFRQEI